MAFEINKQGVAGSSNITAKVYNGDPNDWPYGVYIYRTSKRNHAYLIVTKWGVVQYEDDALSLCRVDRWSIGWTRISDDPSIPSILFGGSLNYPDGRPASESEVAS